MRLAHTNIEVHKNAQNPDCLHSRRLLEGRDIAETNIDVVTANGARAGDD